MQGINKNNNNNTNKNKDMIAKGFKETVSHKWNTVSHKWNNLLYS